MLAFKCISLVKMTSERDGKFRSSLSWLRGQAATLVGETGQVRYMYTSNVFNQSFTVCCGKEGVANGLSQARPFQGGGCRDVW